MTSSLKHKHQESLNSQPKHLAAQQLHLLASPKEEATPPATIPKSISAKLAPGCWHRTKVDRYWLVCGFDGRPFGGLYYRSEVDHILEHFEGWRGPITPATFGIVAERAIHLRNRQMGVIA